MHIYFHLIQREIRFRLILPTFLCPIACVLFFWREFSLSFYILSLPILYEDRHKIIIHYLFYHLAIFLCPHPVSFFLFCRAFRTLISMHFVLFAPKKKMNMQSRAEQMKANKMGKKTKRKEKFSIRQCLLIKISLKKSSEVNLKDLTFVVSFSFHLLPFLLRRFTFVSSSYVFKLPVLLTTFVFIHFYSSCCCISCLIIISFFLHSFIHFVLEMKHSLKCVV